MYLPLTEFAELLAVIDPASYAAEQNTGWLDISKYERVTVIIIAGDIGTSLDADIEIATDGSGTGLHTLKSITQLTEAGGDDNSQVAIEIRAEELSKPSGAPSQEYTHLQLELTPTGATIVGAIVLGHCPRLAPVPVTTWAEVVA